MAFPSSPSAAPPAGHAHPGRPSHPWHLVVMGVSGCGKSSLAAAVARALDLPMIEGDDFHAETSRDKMRRGLALTDDDRAGWLATLAGELQRRPGGAVLACSALRRRHREVLRRAVPDLRFAFLDIDEATARARVAHRHAGHLFPPGLVASQFATLEPPLGEAGVLRLDAGQRPVAALCADVMGWLRQAPDG